MAKSKPARSINILFIGNSFTQRNNLPELLAKMAAAREVSVTHELISVGGASLRTHWNAGGAAKAIATGGYDYVVLQEQSTLPVKNAKRMAENVPLFDEAIRQAGSKTVLYMTWARQHTPEAQQVIADAYNAIGKELGALVVPVGMAWQSFLAKYKRPVLHDRDQSHPTLAGLVSGRLRVPRRAAERESRGCRIRTGRTGRVGRGAAAGRSMEAVRSKEVKRGRCRF